MLHVRSGLVSTLLAIGSTLSNAASQDLGAAAATGSSCRVAVCLSGHIRSFVHSAVHRSIRRNLVEAIEADGCDVDVFAYATAADTVASIKQGRNSEFTSNSTDIEAALALLAPTRTVWHQDQAGRIPNSCAARKKQAPPFAAATTAATAATATPAADNGGGRDSGMGGLWTDYWQAYKDEASGNLYWQLYRSLAAYRMALREEKQRGGDFTYDWIVRARFDVAWARPLPPLRSFSQEAVWFGAHYWPMSDHFALVPRAFSDRFFSTVNGFYACDGVSWPPTPSWFQPECGGTAFEESVLFRHLHATDVPYRFYPMFEYMLTRGSRGAVCDLGSTVYLPACVALVMWEAFKEPISGAECVAALSGWANLRCRTLFPGGGMNDERRTDAVLDPSPRAWEALIGTPMPLPSPGTVSGEVDPELTTVPEMSELDRVRSKLAVLRDGLREPPLPPKLVPPPTVPGGGGGGGGGVGGGGGGGDSHGGGGDGDGEGRSGSGRFEADEWRTPLRLESWSEHLPPSWVSSPPGCPLEKPQHPGITPHLVMYLTMGTALVEEMAQAVKCFSHSLIEGTGWAGKEFDSSFCNEIRPLELVMIDVSRHIKELGLCTADSRLGLNAEEYVSRFFGEPDKHCVGYGQLEL